MVAKQRRCGVSDQWMVSPLASVVEHAESGGDRVAVIDSDGQFTFSELVEHAGGVADRLTDDRAPVVVLTSYSRHAVAAIFGVVLAGRGVVPLDPISLGRVSRP